VPPGTGLNYTWVISVADQVSAPSPSTTSYLPPTVTGVSISDSVAAGGALQTSTKGGATVIITGTNFGGDVTQVCMWLCCS
jgi:hypothetical protein